MYKRFFNLTRNPFDLTPDPYFLFASRSHNEALANLYYGVRQHRGFVVLTGEVGTGKTLLLRRVLQLFARSTDIAYAYVFNGRLSPTEFLQYIVADFGLPASGKNKAELLGELSNYVLWRGSKDLTTVLALDEAHQLSADILEEVRLLTNLETTSEKLLQVLLVGQPELDHKLDSVRLRQLKQRIALRSHLSPLNVKETKEYVEWRLHVAGAQSTLFTEQTIEAIYNHSHGLPRLINTICENALIAAYARGMRSVTEDIVANIAGDLRLDVPSAEVGGDDEREEMDVKCAAKMFLDLHAWLHKPIEPDTRLRVPSGTRFL